MSKIFNDRFTKREILLSVEFEDKIIKHFVNSVKQSIRTTTKYFDFSNLSENIIKDKVSFDGTLFTIKDNKLYIMPNEDKNIHITCNIPFDIFNEILPSDECISNELKSCHIDFKYNYIRFVNDADKQIYQGYLSRNNIDDKDACVPLKLLPDGDIIWYNYKLHVLLYVANAIETACSLIRKHLSENLNFIN